MVDKPDDSKARRAQPPAPKGAPLSRAGGAGGRSPPRSDGQPPKTPQPPTPPPKQSDESWVGFDPNAATGWIEKQKSTEDWTAATPRGDGQGGTGSWVDSVEDAEEKDVDATRPSPELYASQDELAVQPSPELYASQDELAVSPLAKSQDELDVGVPVTAPGSDDSGGIPTGSSDELAIAGETVAEQEAQASDEADQTIEDLPFAEGAVAGIGRKLGDYVLEKKIGQGGMGEVYRARQTSLDRVVAIKILPKMLAAQPDFIERFKREAMSAAGLIHPNVIQMYSYGIDDGRPYFAMEYVEGEDLAQRMKRQKHLATTEVVDLLMAVASALAVAHEKGVIHRDIKPSNIMIDRNGLVKVMDFGLAKATSGGHELTHSGLIMGTPNYLSPEQGRGDPLDGRSDLYSLGVVLYETLTGQVPFKADTPAGLIFKHVYEEPEPPSARNPNVPAFLETVCLKLLAKASEERYESARALVADLQEYKTHEAHYQAEKAPPRPPKPIGDETELDQRPVGKRSSKRAPKAGGDAASSTQTIVVEKASWGPAIAVVVVLLGLVGAGVGWLVWSGRWERVTKVEEKPVHYDTPWSEADRRKALVRVEGSEGRFALPADVKPGPYTLRLERDGYEPIAIAVQLEPGGVMRDTRDGAPVGSKPPRWTAIPALREPYDSARVLIAEAEQQWVDKGNLDRDKLATALGFLEAAARLDPDYRPPAETGKQPAPTVAELKKKTDALRAQGEQQGADRVKRSEELSSGKRWHALRDLVEAQKDKANKYWSGLKAKAEEGIAAGERLATETKDAVLSGDSVAAASKLGTLKAEDPESAESLAPAVEAAGSKRATALTAASVAKTQRELEGARALFASYFEAVAPLGTPHDVEAQKARDTVERNLKTLSDFSGPEQALRVAVEKHEWRKALETAWQIQRADRQNKTARDLLPTIERELRASEVGEALRVLDDALGRSREKPDAVLTLIAPDAQQTIAIERKALADMVAINGRITKSHHDDLKIEPQGQGPDAPVRVVARWQLEVALLGEAPRQVELRHVLAMKRVGADWRFTSFSVEGKVGGKR